MDYKVYVTNKIPAAALEMLTKVAQVQQWMEDIALPYEVLAEKTRDIDGLLCLLIDTIDARIIKSARRLKVISTFAVGYDNIDTAQATRSGIPVSNTPGVLSETTADLAFALLMAAARKIPQSDKYVRNGQWKIAWQPMLMLGQDIHNSTLGIVGMGRIGTEMARRGKGFRMRVLYNDQQRRKDIEKELGVEYVSLPKLLAESDFVSLHVPLTENTHKLVGRAELALMKPTAILVNTSRGSVIDQKALYEALKSGKIAGAALDVTEKEPIPMNDPLLELDNIVFSPHIGSASTATRTRMALMAAENLIAGLKGERLPHCVNPEVYQNA